MARIGDGFDSPTIEQDPGIAQIQAAQLGAQTAQQQVSLPATGFVASINGEEGAVTIQPGTSSISAGVPSVTTNVTNGVGTVSIGVVVHLYAAALAKSNTAIIAPTVNDDSGDGYAPFSTWIDTVLGDVYMAVDVTVGAAIWRKLN